MASTEISALTDGGVVLDTDLFVVSRSGAGRKVTGARLVRTNASGNSVLAGDAVLSAGYTLNAGLAPLIGGDGGAYTYLYSGTTAFSVRNAADNSTLLTISNAGAISSTGTLNITGAITQNGNQVWHAANLTPANYALLTGAAFSGSISAPVVRIDASALFTVTGSVTYWYNDALDYTYYDRTANLWGVAINDVAKLTINATAASLATSLSVAGALTQAGNQVWHAGNLTPGNYALLAGAAFSGGISAPTVSGFDANFRMGQSGGNPLLIMDAADFIGYNRSGNFFDFSIGGTSKAYVGTAGVDVFGTLTVNGNAAWHAGNFNPANYAALAGSASFSGIVSASALRLNADTNVSLTKPTGTLVDVGFDVGDVLRFNQSANQWDFIVGGSSNLSISASAIVTPNSINASALQVGGYAVWHAGNFNPGSYATIASPALTGTPTAPTAAGGTNTTQIATTAFVTSGLAGKQASLGFTPANKAGDTFSAAFGRDATFFLDLVSANPRVTFDTGDYVEFDRTANKFKFAVGGTVVASIDASGNLKVLGTLTAATAP